MVTDDEFFLADLDDSASINAALWKQFSALLGTDRVRGTHLFEGRYENLYVERAEIPAIEPVLAAARAQAARRIGCAPERLSVGFWFNLMEPGQVTLPHSHDDDDELLSGVYYVRVPPHSGELVLHLPAGRLSIEPRAGRFAFFSPRLLHEVEKNQGDQSRLSIGMNFGIRA